MHALSSIYSGNTVPISGGRTRIAMNTSVKEPNHLIATLKTEKLILDTSVHIPKEWQILKRFTGTFHEILKN